MKASIWIVISFTDGFPDLLEQLVRPPLENALFLCLTAPTGVSSMSSILQLSKLLARSLLDTKSDTESEARCISTCE